MDPAIIAGMIGAIGTIIAACITIYFSRRRKVQLPSTEDHPTEPHMIADIRGTWHSDFNGESDTITIESVEGRKVSGFRLFRSKSGSIRKYDVSGFFDGILLVLAVTSQDQRETRTLAIVLVRETGNRFVGRRTYLHKRRIVSNTIREWIRQR